MEERRKEICTRSSPFGTLQFFRMEGLFGSTAAR